MFQIGAGSFVRSFRNTNHHSSFHHLHHYSRSMSSSSLSEASNCFISLDFAFYFNFERRGEEWFGLLKAEATTTTTTVTVNNRQSLYFSLRWLSSRYCDSADLSIFECRSVIHLQTEICHPVSCCTKIRANGMINPPPF